MRILNKLISRLEVPQSKVFINVSNYGNTSAASIPIALDEANNSGRIHPGDTVLFCSFGGGFYLGSSPLEVVDRRKTWTIFFLKNNR